MASRAHFTKDLFKFLRDIKRHNNKDWFAENKQRYEADVRDPLLQFIADFAAPLAKISEHFVADSRPSGGSLFRIHRDTRFSKDKTPYKTAAAAQFRHEAGKDVHAPGFYLHLEPGNVMAGVGLWQPDSAALKQIRDAIVDGPEKWRRVAHGKAFRARWELSGESLKRPPQGYDPEHPFLEDLRRKDFCAMIPFTEEAACAAGFLEQYAKACREAAALVAFLAQAVGLPF